jgi:choline monooxygenase
MLNRYGKWLDTNTVYPIDTEKCAVVFEWYLEKDPNTMRDKDTVAEELKASNQVQDEDEELCAQVQAGMHSKFFKQGRYAPNVETAMYHFHDLLLKDLNMTVENC